LLKENNIELKCSIPYDYHSVPKVGLDYIIPLDKSNIPHDIAQVLESWMFGKKSSETVCIHKASHLSALLHGSLNFQLA